MAQATVAGPRNFSLIGFIRLVRVGNLFIVVATQYLAGIFLIGQEDSWWSRLTDRHLFLLTLSTIMIAAAGYIINDYYDVKIDVINKPQRVVIDRLLKRRVAMGAHLVLSTLGIVIGTALHWKVGLINIGAAGLLWLYSSFLKRLPLLGNLTIALLTSSTLAVLAVYYRQNEAMLFTFAIYAFFMTLVREIVKDLEDMRGDASHGCKTLPILWGVSKTKKLIYGLIAAFIAVLFPLSALLSDRVGYFFLLLLLPLSWLTVLLVRADTVQDFTFLSRLCKWIMIAGMLSMLLL
ncbi:4-hydroxybenzoate polyprenyltransferase [Catalinimonas alkaloidigena]|uniref:4-hydroxybenzoate polyprenyltransferase n=1 Tax=Catalinimonas alkaloidigena TaxID=1075417 RepID=A0A1G9EHM5_9BACT|nr:geranylgeranylglycerol-phosphate geranylgeranyltransferase [Catalinimonas alkaloidigena]SDK75588.1 4-hydroxybenzoate polyprenyltransferase [Catalinimonas alkaloidigena]